MNDTLCSKFDFMRKHLPDKLGEDSILDFYQIENIKKYCPDENCDTDFDKNTAGFLWLLGECYSTVIDKSYKENNTNVFFLYMISWFSYKLNQITGNKFTKINDLYTNYVKNSGKYEAFITDAYRIGDLKGFMDERNDLLNINIEDLSKFYDAFNLLCIMYGRVAQNKKDDKLLNDAKDFVKKYQELNRYSNNTDVSSYRQILSSLSTNYDDLKIKCKNDQTLPEIPASIYALTSEDTSSSSIGNKLFTVLSIFGAIAFFLGI
ncbi:YIR protein, partial [Plasmodium yoelii]